MALACLILVGCNSIPFWGSSDKKSRARAEVKPPVASVMVRPTIQDPAHTAFQYRPTTAKETPREDLLRLINATNGAYEALGFREPYPLIRIVGPNDSRLSSRQALATATIDENDKEVLYFNREWIASGRPMQGVVTHEYAHFQTWRQYGHRVYEHGREFWAVCTAATNRKNCTKYEGRFG